jgi:hypothetical protein
MKNNGPGSLRFLGWAFLVVTGLSLQGCKSSGSGIKPDAATSSGNAAGSGGAVGEGGNGGITTVAGSSGGHAQGGAGGTSVAGSTNDQGGAGATGTLRGGAGSDGATDTVLDTLADTALSVDVPTAVAHDADVGIDVFVAPEIGTDAGACSGAALLCCRSTGFLEDAIVATCAGGKWTCPEGLSLTQTTETYCCLPEGSTTLPVCAYGQVECPSGSSPCGGSVPDGGTCAGDGYCCPTVFSAEPFHAPYCLGGRWVCPRSGSVPAAGAPGVCCLPDGGTAPTECVGDVIMCSPSLGGTLCAPADAGHD